MNALWFIEVNKFQNKQVCLFISLFSFSVFALIELLLTAAGFIFTLALGVVITVGLDDTCIAFNKVNDNNPDTKFMPYVLFRHFKFLTHNTYIIGDL